TLKSTSPARSIFCEPTITSSAPNGDEPVCRSIAVFQLSALAGVAGEPSPASYVPNFALTRIETPVALADAKLSRLSDAARPVVSTATQTRESLAPGAVGVGATSTATASAPSEISNV